MIDQRLAGAGHPDGDRYDGRRPAAHATAPIVLTVLWVISALPTSVPAQVAIAPGTTSPASWERFAVRVVNAGDTAVTGVHVAVPEIVTVLGVEPVPGWTFAARAPSDTTPQTITWSGGTLSRGEFREFAFLGRVAGDARERQLVFPVTLARATGEMLEWAGAPGRPRPAPRVLVVGPTRMSARGVLAVAGSAVGIALLALALALSARAVATGRAR